MKQSFIVALAIASLSYAAPAYPAAEDTSSVSVVNTTAIATATATGSKYSLLRQSSYVAKLTADPAEVPISSSTSTATPDSSVDALSRLMGVSSSKVAIPANSALDVLAKVNVQSLSLEDQSLLDKVAELLHKLLEELLGSLVPGSGSGSGSGSNDTAVQRRQLGQLGGLLGQLTQLPLVGPLVQGLLGALLGGGLGGLTDTVGGLTGGLTGGLPGLGGGSASGAGGVVPTGLPVAGGAGGVLGGLPVVGGKFKAQDLKVTQSQLDLARNAESLLTDLVAKLKVQGIVN